MPEKMKIEDAILQYLDIDMQATALNFVAYMCENKMSLRRTTSTDWTASYKTKTICWIRLKGAQFRRLQAKWEVRPNLINIDTYDNEIIDENMQNYIWDGLTYCGPCINSKGQMRQCSPGINKILLNKDIGGICAGFFSNNRKPIGFHNPDEKAINIIKRLFELEKQVRNELAILAKK